MSEDIKLKDIRRRSTEDRFIEIVFDFENDTHTSIAFAKGSTKEEVIYNLRRIAIELEHNPLFKA